MKPLYISLKPFLDHCTLSRPTDWTSVFGNDRPLEVEIGIGNGEYLARLCQESPASNYVGFEEYCERISRSLRKLSRVPNDHVRVMRMDVRPAFTYLFAPRSIHYIHCLFPPPWPKKSDIKHRLFTTDFLRLTNNRLADGAKLKVVTDFKPYAEWIKEQIPGCGFELSETVIGANYGTKFERKWADGGQTEFYELICSKIEHLDVDPKKECELKFYAIPGFDPDKFRMDEYSDGKIAVVFRDILYDPKQMVALIHVMVNDEHLLQNVRVVVLKSPQGWRVHLAQGSMLMPTEGVAKALECVRDAALKTI